MKPTHVTELSLIHFKVQFKFKFERKYPALFKSISLNLSVTKKNYYPFIKFHFIKKQHQKYLRRNIPTEGMQILSKVRLG